MLIVSAPPAPLAVRGHQSSLAFGYLGATRVPVVCQLGRFHAYEGFAMEQVAFPARIMKLLGAEIIILTNAAGGLDPAGTVGTIMPIVDHLSLPSLVRSPSSRPSLFTRRLVPSLPQTSWNPLIGPNRESLGPRFPPMSDGAR